MLLQRQSHMSWFIVGNGLLILDLTRQSPSEFDSGASTCGNTVRQWNPDGPRLVSNLGQDYYIICIRYVCNACQREFCGYDNASVEKMPQFIQNLLPRRVFPKTAVDYNVQSLISAAVTRGISFSAVKQIITETNVSSMLTKNSKLVEFGEFHDKDGWNCLIPNVNVLKKVFTERGVRSYLNQSASMMRVVGDVLSSDHTFKVSNIVKSDYQRFFKACYSIMNEYGMICAYWQVNSTSLAEIETQLLAFADRYRNLGAIGPLLWYIDI
ncbi:hypothetical protein MIR68_011808 [Amoeboaphelidium protococcarum]|nr:hypothetical protein MIR68_011808 [Amoeboaphelidium protococcarum]